MSDLAKADTDAQREAELFARMDQWGEAMGFQVHEDMRFLRRRLEEAREQIAALNTCAEPGGDTGTVAEGSGRGSKIRIEIEESERQLILLALAVLSLASPGFDGALNTIAVRIDNIDAGRAKAYDEFRRLRRDTIAEAPQPEHPTPGDRR